MPDKASQSSGWLVRVRVPGNPDEFYAAVISDAHDAVEQVRDALQAKAPAQVEVVRELSDDEFKRVRPRKIVLINMP